jgi:hypothetical protein
MELYHITKEKHLASILSNGLKINSNKTGFCKRDAHKRYKSIYGMQPIFLTNDIEFISKKMLTNCWVNKNKAVVLKVTIELDETNSSEMTFKNSLNEIEPKEFRYYSNIDPKNIEVVKVDFKSFNLLF